MFRQPMDGAQALGSRRLTTCTTTQTSCTTEMELPRQRYPWVRLLILDPALPLRIHHTSRILLLSRFLSQVLATRLPAKHNRPPRQSQLHCLHPILGINGQKIAFYIGSRKMSFPKIGLMPSKNRVCMERIS